MYFSLSLWTEEPYIAHFLPYSYLKLFITFESY